MSRVFLAGATGYIGRHVARELVERGHEVICFVRDPRAALPGAEVQVGEVTDPDSLTTGFANRRFDAVISCLATRGGGVRDSWLVEHQANLNLLKAGQSAKIERFILLSAICVQKPHLEFQRAKLAFEHALIDSGVLHSIVRPTAFFKSLSGQVEKVKAGKPFLVFGDGELTRCKPISERDLARFIVDRLDDPQSAILPVGGPDAPITPKAQGELLFELLGRPPKLKRIPVRMFDPIIATLSAASRIVPALRDKAEFARIGRYYATESMLLWDEAQERYAPEATPSFGQDTLRAHYARVLEEGMAGQELGDHSMF